MSAELTHGPECPCVRCTGFLSGHDLSTRHGAYAAPSSLRLAERTLEITELLAEYAPHVPAPVLQVGATVIARVEAADRALAEVDAAIGEDGRALSAYLGKDTLPLERLRQDARGWTNAALRWFESLGLTPKARAQIEESLADRSTRVSVSTSVSLATNSEWQLVRARIVEALQPHPQALEAVRRALEEAGS